MSDKRKREFMEKLDSCYSLLQQSSEIKKREFKRFCFEFPLFP